MVQTGSASPYIELVRARLDYQLGKSAALSYRHAVDHLRINPNGYARLISRGLEELAEVNGLSEDERRLIAEWEEFKEFRRASVAIRPSLSEDSLYLGLFTVDDGTLRTIYRKVLEGSGKFPSGFFSSFANCYGLLEIAIADTIPGFFDLSREDQIRRIGDQVLTDKDYISGLGEWYEGRKLESLVKVGPFHRASGAEVFGWFGEKVSKKHGIISWFAEDELTSLRVAGTGTFTGIKFEDRST